MAQQAEEATKSRHMGSGFTCYSDVQQTHLVSQLQPFQSSSSEIYSMAAGIEMIGFQPKDLFLDKPRTDNFSLGISDQSLWQENNHSYNHNNNNNIRSLLVEESSQRCVLSCEGNERPIQGISLSLSSDNPSTIGLQSFELRQTHHQQGDFRLISSGLRDWSGEKSAFQRQYHVSVQGQGGQFPLLRSSKYLVPAQELLNELCCLGKQQTAYDDGGGDELKKQKQEKNKGICGDREGDHTNNGKITSASSSRPQQSLFAVDLTELQKRKKNLVAMLDELDRRYKHYKDQMRAMVYSFNEVAGEGAANGYTSSTSKAISRHFRCLRDGIMGQFKATKVAMGEMDGGVITLGSINGETPRLRALDQALRQQKAFQHMSLMENQPWRPQRGLPERSVSVLRAWLFEHFLHPYPSDVDKQILARQAGLTRSQVSNWFINARVRLWKPMVEEMYLEETKEEQPGNFDMVSSSAATGDGGRAHDSVGGDHCGPTSTFLTKNPQAMLLQDQQPTLLDGFKFLSNVISTTNKSTRVGERFGGPTSMYSLGFSSYNQNDQNAPGEGFSLGVSAGIGGGGSVSLTLGLQQNGGAGAVSLASFSPVGPPSSVFYTRDGVEDYQPVVEYSSVDGDHI